MADKTFHGSVANIDGSVYIEDLLVHVFEKQGITRDPSLPDRYLETLRSIADYIFTPIVGDAVVEKLKRLPAGLAKACIDKADSLKLDSPVPGEFLTNYLLRAKVMNLSHDVFISDRRRWCAEVFDYLVLITDLCVYLHQNNHLFTFMEVVSVAGNTFHKLVEISPKEKIEYIEEVSTKIITNPENPDAVICLE